MSELSTRLEAMVFEARHLLACKAHQQPRMVLELPETEKKLLEEERTKRMQDLLQKSALGMVKAIMAHKFAYVFNSPVDTTAYPTYLETCPMPMDLGTIKDRLEQGGHYTHVQQVWGDVCLVFNNAKLFNPPGSDVNIMAQTLQEVAEDKWEKGVAAKVSEETANHSRDEAAAKRRYAESLSRADAAAVEQQALAVMAVLEELSLAVSDAKSQAAVLCDALSPAELTSLGAALKDLPPRQLQAAVQLVAARCPGLLRPVPLPEGIPEQPGVPARKLSLRPDHYPPVVQRQLQLFTRQCAAAPPLPHPPSEPPQEQEHVAPTPPAHATSGQAEHPAPATGAVPAAGTASAVASGTVPEPAAETGAEAPPADAPPAADVSTAAPAPSGTPRAGGQDAGPAGMDVGAAPPADAAPTMPPPAPGGVRAATTALPVSPFASADSQGLTGSGGAGAPPGLATAPSGVTGPADGGAPQPPQPPQLPQPPQPPAALVVSSLCGETSGGLRTMPDFLATAQAHAVTAGAPAAHTAAGVSSLAGCVWPPVLPLGAGRRARARTAVPGGEHFLALQKKERGRRLHHHHHHHHLHHHHPGGPHAAGPGGPHVGGRGRKALTSGGGVGGGPGVRRQASSAVPSPWGAPPSPPLPPVHVTHTVNLPSFPAPPIAPPPPPPGSAAQGGPSPFHTPLPHVAHGAPLGTTPSGGGGGGPGRGRKRDATAAALRSDAGHHDHSAGPPSARHTAGLGNNASGGTYVSSPPSSGHAPQGKVARRQSQDVSGRGGRTASAGVTLADPLHMDLAAAVAAIVAVAPGDPHPVPAVAAAPTKTRGRGKRAAEKPAPAPPQPPAPAAAQSPTVIPAPPLGPGEEDAAGRTVSDPSITATPPGPTSSTQGGGAPASGDTAMNPFAAASAAAAAGTPPRNAQQSGVPRGHKGAAVLNLELPSRPSTGSAGLVPVSSLPLPPGVATTPLRAVPSGGGGGVTASPARLATATAPSAHQSPLRMGVVPSGLGAAQTSAPSPAPGDAAVPPAASPLPPAPASTAPASSAAQQGAPPPASPAPPTEQTPQAAEPTPAVATPPPPPLAGDAAAPIPALGAPAVAPTPPPAPAAAPAGASVAPPAAQPTPQPDPGPAAVAPQLKKAPSVPTPPAAPTPPPTSESAPAPGTVGGGKVGATAAPTQPATYPAAAVLALQQLQQAAAQAQAAQQAQVQAQLAAAAAQAPGGALTPAAILAAIQAGNPSLLIPPGSRAGQGVSAAAALPAATHAFLSAFMQQQQQQQQQLAGLSSHAAGVPKLPPLSAHNSGMLSIQPLSLAPTQAGGQAGGSGGGTAAGSSGGGGLQAKPQLSLTAEQQNLITALLVGKAAGSSGGAAPPVGEAPTAGGAAGAAAPRLPPLTGTQSGPAAGLPAALAALQPGVAPAAQPSAAVGAAGDLSANAKVMAAGQAALTQTLTRVAAAGGLPAQLGAANPLAPVLGAAAGGPTTLDQSALMLWAQSLNKAGSAGGGLDALRRPGQPSAPSPAAAAVAAMPPDALPGLLAGLLGALGATAGGIPGLGGAAAGGAGAGAGSDPSKRTS